MMFYCQSLSKIIIITLSAFNTGTMLCCCCCCCYHFFAWSKAHRNGNIGHSSFAAFSSAEFCGSYVCVCVCLVVLVFVFVCFYIVISIFITEKSFVVQRDFLLLELNLKRKLCTEFIFPSFI